MQEVDLGIGKIQGRGLAHVISIFFEMVVMDLTREGRDRGNKPIGLYEVKVVSFLLS